MTWVSPIRWGTEQKDGLSLQSELAFPVSITVIPILPPFSSYTAILLFIIFVLCCAFWRSPEHEAVDELPHFCRMRYKPLFLRYYFLRHIPSLFALSLERNIMLLAFIIGKLYYPHINSTQTPSFPCYSRREGCKSREAFPAGNFFLWILIPDGDSLGSRYVILDTRIDW